MLRDTLGAFLFLMGILSLLRIRIHLYLDLIHIVYQPVIDSLLKHSFIVFSVDFHLFLQALESFS